MLNVGFEDDLKSLQRKLDQKLYLVVDQLLGKRPQWIFPQTTWRGPESLRKTAERALQLTCGDDLQITTLAGTPVGWYKYKYPVESELGSRFYGAKVRVHFGATPSLKHWAGHFTKHFGKAEILIVIDECTDWTGQSQIHLWLCQQHNAHAVFHPLDIFVTLSQFWSRENAMAHIGVRCGQGRCWGLMQNVNAAFPRRRS